MYRFSVFSSGLLASLFGFALLAPMAVTAAQAQTPRAVPRDSQIYRDGRDSQRNSQAYREGYDRGSRAGGDDGQRNRPFNFQNNSDYRNDDRGWRREYGDRDRWRTDFRLGFEFGYRESYSRYRPGYGGVYGNGGYGNSYPNGNYGGYGNNGRGRGGPPPWANNRGSWQRSDYAFQTGFTDGYEAGLNDGRSNRRFDPIGEGRYRSGDHGYNRNYGTREAYKFRYRDAFREGYEQGYQDGQRYDSRNYRRDGRPSWWPW